MKWQFTSCFDKAVILFQVFDLKYLVIFIVVVLIFII